MKYPFIAKSNKYRNKTVETPEGMVFDSLREYERFRELQLLEKCGEISGLRRQVKYILIPAQYEMRIERDGKCKGGKLIERECSYYADFVYQDHGKTVVEDTKGMRTKEYIIKRKLMLYVHGIRIREV